MKVKQLMEGLTPIIYHYTNITNAERILKTNTFKLKLDLPTRAEREVRHKDNFYYLSTTRSKVGGFHKDPGNYSVVFVLDGRQLHYNYPAKAIDYWGHDFRKIDPTKFEAEDRIYSYKPFINNAKKYIKEVHILMMQNTGFSVSDVIKKNARKLLIDLKKSGISSYIYDNKNNFVTQNKNKAINLDITAVTPEEPPAKPYPDRPYRWGQDIRAVIELYYARVGSKLSDNAEKYMYYLKSDYRNEAHNAIENDMSNAAGARMKGADELAKIVRRERFGTIKELIDMLKEKWKNA